MIDWFEIKRAFAHNKMYWMLAAVAFVALVFLVFLFADFFSREGRERRRRERDFQQRLKEVRKGSS